MKLALRALLCVAAIIGFASRVEAVPITATVVSSCGGSAFTAGNVVSVFEDTTGVLCTAGGGGGGGAVTIANGADIALGNTADAAWSGSGSATLIAIQKKIEALLAGGIGVTGTFFQATQPVSGTVTANAGSGTFAISAASLPLPTSAATSALQTTGNTSLTSIITALGAPFQAGGSIGNTSFGISGSLPAFGATPTFNLGTLNGAATDASVTGLQVGQGSTTSGQRGMLIQGAVATSAPTLVTANTYPLSMTTSGGLRVDGSGATQPVSGTVTANAGTGTFAISASSLPLPTSAATSTKQSDGSQKTQIVDGSGNVIASTSNNLNVQCANCSGSGVSTADQASFTAGSSLFAGGGGFFQTTATSNPLTTGQQGLFQVTANRALFSNLRNAAGTEMGTASNPLQMSLANTGSNATSLNVICTSGCSGSGGTASNFASAFPTAGTAIGVKNGSNMVNLTADASSNLNVVVAAALPAGTNVIGHVIADSGSTTAVTGTVTVSGSVTANAGTNLNTSALALDTSVNGVLLSQASTTSGQKGPLIQGAVTTAAPTYVTANSYPLSLNTAGGLRVDGSGVTQPASLATLPALTAGSAIVGKVGIDQTTPGTTNAVSATNFPTTVDVNSGNKSASTLRVVLATDQPQLTNKLLVTPDANSSVNLTQIGGGAVPSLGTGIQGVAIAPTATAAAGIAPVVCGSASASCVLKAGAGNLYSGYVVPTVAGYLMIFNKTTDPADGSTTAGIAANGMQVCVPAPANSPTYFSHGGEPPEVFSTGMTAVFSTTGCSSKTESATAFFHFGVQ